ncbi:isochorismate synthase [Staphylococcus cohnii]|uniref:isochorismate synthase n=1 Tax=Staphylococcus cohnii species complex TaxID=3239053 RepID=UPI00085CC3B0|nr:isochorismate synthase [Staphylococcus ureilyticus]PTF46956.1 isochorismate synthase [Staphylococcus cohnii]SCS63696.1 menaquinone-specific isochorismate synthase [Staphylococcus cohnii subsp. cohnii]PTG41887.1 isochorismate synthase [Staphylococcus cohnii]PUZ34626.1 isochorismate synthase [Staphylococcus cohnii]HJG65910.1 isochorismate synthase [Staphylococcus ureilyticus]
MTLDVKESEIVEAVYESNHTWVSVEAKLDYELEPTLLFHLTEDCAGDRFYFKKNDNETSFFGYHAITRFKNDFENKQSIFREWEKYKNDIELIHPNSERHHLKICGGFQFSTHKSGDEWREFGINHFALPEVLVTMEQGQSFITYTVEADKFEIDTFLAIIDRLTQKDVQPSDEIGDIKRIDDIYKDEWRELVKDTIDILDENKKIVLARKRLIMFDKNINIPYILNRAMQGEHNSYLFVLESQDSVFFSQTPEQLMEVKDDVLSTKAVAGTIKRTHRDDIDKANIDAFLNDDKNLNEHHFVVKSILNDIKPYVEEITFNKKPQILTNDHLYHLYTKIEGRLLQNSYIGLLDNLHPTPALGGYPKEEAISYIENNEFGTRGLYGAPVGYIDMYDNCEFIVAIRSMLIKKNQATLFAGCGIVQNSDADSEVEETAVKFNPMMKALGVEKYE